MIDLLLQPVVQQFIHAHEHDDVRELALKLKPVGGIPVATLAVQIKGRQKAREKFPLLYRHPNIIYPPAINIEQSSSQATAELKAKLVRDSQLPGGPAADLTGGFGIDSIFLSKLFQEHHYIEPDENLFEIACHNFRTMGLSNITCHATTAEQFLTTTQGQFDLIFVDPSRRSASAAKGVQLADCEPDVVGLLDQILAKTNNLLIKTSPLLDIHAAIHDLKWVKTIIVVSLNNDCKEVLYHVDGLAKTSSPVVKTYNIASSVEQFDFLLADEALATPSMQPVQQYLFEPNSAIMKAGAFKSVAKHFNIAKLHASTHLYTSNKIISGFPGRTFKVIAQIKADAKAAANVIADRKANVATRNYPLKSEELKKKLGLQDGGNAYVWGVTDQEGKKVFVTERV